MYCYKAKRIEIHHTSTDIKIFEVGDNYIPIVENSEIVNIEFEQLNGMYAARLFSIYIQYILKNERDLQKTYEVFLKYAGNDLIAELDIKKQNKDE